jgi:tetratricopeptide (TPR) repeat protein
MKRIFFLILFLFSIVSFGQKEDYFENEIYKNAKAYLIAWESNNRFELPSSQERKMMKKSNEIREYSITKAYENFQLLISNYPNSKKYFEYVYQKAYIEFNTQRFDESKKSLNKIIEENKYEWDGNDRNPYILLASIAVEEKQFSLGLDYLKKVRIANESIQCGNEFISNESRQKLKSLYESCIIGLK